MNEKLCVFCTNLYIIDTRGCGSTLTGPYGEKGFSCLKRHFDQYDSQVDSIEEYRTFILRAETCPDYSQVEI